MTQSIKHSIISSMKVFLFTLFLLFTKVTNAQMIIGPGTAHPSAQLDVSSPNKGLLPPRMYMVQRDAIANPTAGLMVFCTDCNIGGQMQVYNGTSWVNTLGGTSKLGLAFNCNRTLSPDTTFIKPQTTRPYQATATYTYSNGIGQAYPAQTISSTGVQGLVANLAAGTLANGSGSIVFNISGAAGGNLGTAYFDINFLGKNCPLTLPVEPFRFSIGDTIPGGFKVIYVLNPGDVINYDLGDGAGTQQILYDANISHGLVADKINLIEPNPPVGYSNGMSWAQAITNAQSSVAGGYSDWFLPDQTQLNWLYQAKVAGAINIPSTTFYLSYWSSTTYFGSSTAAWFQKLTDGAQAIGLKTDGSANARAVKAF